MKKYYCLLFSGALAFAGCTEDKYVLDVYSTMRYDVLALPTAADTLSLNTVDFVSAREGFVGGANGSLFVTSDAGQTWTRRSQPTLGTINKLLFTSATTGWAGTSNGLYRTTNGGQSWTGVMTYDSYGSASGSITDLQFVTSQVGYAVGAGGSINKTTNGGTTWASVHRRIDKRYTFQAVSFTSVDSGTVVGDERSRWLTDDGGKTWDIFDYRGNPQDNTTHDIIRYNLNTYLLATPRGFEAHDAIRSYKPDNEYGGPVYGLATAGRGGPVVGVGRRMVIRRHEAFSQAGERTPWVYVHAPDGATINATFYAADFADASTFYAVGPRGLVYRFHYQ
ncbi:WD40/YVTN/BNR-like repeat-containing protein [Hymenobacter arizonensis]|uniref:Photosynthesis system II assembly factor YCF48 n=1 Tax=Hymenobacter arizonensis TaxID=1227077 RepID=A0A1I5Z8K2_HYMAR|nr:YCF48-related protein [Hymenobacter arizonensis]SFQ52790.1 Photosynthesis system II assembly factor YCF48 [Hymenobacter arizonensis]